MRFWDSSAIVPLLVRQEATDRMHQLLDTDPDQLVWWGTATECRSAVRRLLREQRLTVEQADGALGLLDLLGRGWSEIAPTEPVRARAAHLLARHSLTAADALQLAAALVWAGPEPVDTRPFVTLDQRLGQAAAREGLSCLP